MARVLGAAAPVLSAIVLVYLGGREQLDYDSVWHVFIARQHDWSQFWVEVTDNAHPPLFYLVLKSTLLIGYSPLIYRLPSILAIVIAGALMCAIASRVVTNRWLPGAAALAFGLSYSAITMGLEVRAYALATCLTLTGLYYYLRLVESRFGEQDPKAHALFASFITLALLTHYSVAFAAAAAVLSPLLLAAANREYRARIGRAWTRALLANLLAFGGPLAVLGMFYLVHGPSLAQLTQHLAGFLFDPGKEGLVAFGLRTTRAEIELFTPVALTDHAVLATAAAVGVAVFLFLAMRGRRLGGEKRTVAMILPVMLAIMIGLTLAAAVAGRYPFGWPLRHQFFLLPFAILSLVVVLDRIDQTLPAGWPRSALTAAVMAGCAASVVGWMVTFSVTPGLMYQRQMDTFRSLSPSARAVYVDQFSLIPLFMHYHEWEWRLEQPAASPSSFRVWKVSKDGRELRVCRDLAHWQLDISEAALYANLQKCLETTGAPEVAMFRLGRNGLPPGWQGGEMSTLMEELAAKAGLRPVSIAIRRGAVFAAFDRAEQ